MWEGSQLTVKSLPFTAESIFLLEFPKVTILIKEKTYKHLKHSVIYGKKKKENKNYPNFIENKNLNKILFF